MKKAAPDGYTVFITTNTTHAANEHLFKKIPYDPVKDFMPVTGLGKGGQIMIVNLDVPAKTVPEFIAYAKQNPGKISMGSGGIGSQVMRSMRSLPANSARMFAFALLLVVVALVLISLSRQLERYASKWREEVAL